MKRVIPNGSCPTKDWQQTYVTISIKKSCDLSVVSLFLPLGNTDFEKMICHNRKTQQRFDQRDT